MNFLLGILSIPRFLFFFAKEVIISNLQVAYDVVTPGDNSRPGIIALEIPPLTDMQLLLLSSMITMTPGTLSLDVSDDRRLLYVHAMYLHDRKAFEDDVRNRYIPHVLRIFRSS